MFTNKNGVEIEITEFNNDNEFSNNDNDNNEFNNNEEDIDNYNNNNDDDDDDYDDYRSEDDEDALKAKIEDMKRVPWLRPMCRVLRSRLHKLKHNNRNSNHNITDSNSNSTSSNIKSNTTDNENEKSNKITMNDMELHRIDNRNDDDMYDYDNEDKMDIAENIIASDENIQTDHQNQEEIHGSLFHVGEIVDIIPRMWPGMNKQGGVARIMKIREDEENGYTYDVRYTVVGGSEKKVLEIYIKSRDLENANNIRSAIKGRCKVLHCPCFIKDCGHIQPGEPGYEEDQIVKPKRVINRSTLSDVIASMKDKQQKKQEKLKINTDGTSRDSLQMITPENREMEHEQRKKMDQEQRKKPPRKSINTSYNEDMIHNKKNKNEIPNKLRKNSSYSSTNFNNIDSNNEMLIEAPPTNNAQQNAKNILNQIIAECENIESNLQEGFIQPENGDNRQLLPRDLLTKAMQRIGTIDENVALAILELVNKLLDDGIKKIIKVRGCANSMNENLSTLLGLNDGSISSNTVKVAWDVIGVVDEAHDISIFIERAAIDTFDKTYRRLGTLNKKDKLNKNQIRCRCILDSAQSNLRQVWRQEKLSINASINAILNRFEYLVGASPEQIVDDAEVQSGSSSDGEYNDDDYFESKKVNDYNYKSQGKSKDEACEVGDETSNNVTRSNNQTKSKRSYSSIFGPDLMIGLENRQGLVAEDREKRSTKQHTSRNEYDDVSDFIIDDVRKKKIGREPVENKHSQRQRRLWIDEDVLKIREESTTDILSSFLSSIASKTVTVNFTRSYFCKFSPIHIQDNFLDLWIDVRVDAEYKRSEVECMKETARVAIDEFFKIITYRMDKGSSHYQEVLSCLFGPLQPNSDDYADTCVLDHVQLESCRAFSLDLFISHLKAFEKKHILNEDIDALGQLLNSLYARNDNYMAGIRAIDWYRRKVRFLKCSMNLHAEKAKLKHSIQEPAEGEDYNSDITAIRLCWYEMENIFQQMIESMITTKLCNKGDEKRPGLATIILIALKKLESSNLNDIDRTNESNVVTLSLDFVALWTELVDCFTNMNIWQSRQACFSKMNSLNFAKKPWRIINKIIQQAKINTKQIIDNEIITNIVEIDSVMNTSVDSILTIIALHSFTLLRILPMNTLKRVPNNWSIMKSITSIYLDDKSEKIDPILGEKLKCRSALCSYIDLYPSLGLVWDLPHEGFETLIGLCAELATSEAPPSSSKKVNEEVLENLVYHEAYDILNEYQGRCGFKSIKKIVSQLFISCSLMDPFAQVPQERNKRRKTVIDVAHTVRLFIRASISDRLSMETITDKSDLLKIKERVESMDGRRMKSIFRLPNSPIIRMITPTASYSPNFYHWLLASLLTQEVVFLFGIEVFESNIDDKNPTEKDNKLLQLLTSSELVNEEDKLFSPHWGITIEEQACLMWLLSAVVFYPPDTLHNSPSKHIYVQKCLVSELFRFGKANGVEMSGDNPFLIDPSIQNIEKTTVLDRRLLLTSFAVVIIWSTSSSLGTEIKVLSLKLILALSHLTAVCASNKGSSNKIRTKKSREGHCIAGFSIACTEFKRLVISTSSSQAVTLDSNLVNAAFPIILELLKRSLNTLKFSGLDCDIQFDFGSSLSKLHDGEKQFNSIAPLYLTNSLSDICMSFINMAGQTNGQPNHKYASSLLINIDKVMNNQEVGRAKSNSTNDNNNVEIQRQSLVGNWLTCILWEPLLRAAAEAKSLLPLRQVGNSRESFTFDGKKKCLEIISSPALATPIKRLLLEFWPSCMSSLMIMTKLAPVIRVVELSEVISCIPDLFPTTCQYYEKFSKFVNFQLVTCFYNHPPPHHHHHDTDNNNKSIEFHKNAKYYLTNFFQLVPLSKEAITNMTKLMMKIIRHFEICRSLSSLSSSSSSFVVKQLYLLRSLMVISIVGSDMPENREDIVKSITEIFGEFKSEAIKAADLCQTIQKVNKRSRSDADNIRLDQTVSMLSYLPFILRCIPLIGYSPRGRNWRDWFVLLQLLVVAWTSRDGLRYQADQGNVGTKILVAWCLSMIRPYTNIDDSPSFLSSLSSSILCQIDGGISQCVKPMIESTGHLCVTSNTSIIENENTKLRSFRQYLLHDDEAWSSLAGEVMETTLTTSTKSLSSSSILATRIALTIHIPYIIEKFKSSSSSSLFHLGIDDWYAIMTSAIVIMIRILRVCQHGSAPRTVDASIGSSILNDPHGYVEDSLVLLLRAMRSGILEVTISDKENDPPLATTIMIFKASIRKLITFLHNNHTNGNIKSNTDDNLDGILGFSITIANFVGQYHKYVACPGIEMNTICDRKDCRLCKGGLIVRELKEQLQCLSSTIMDSKPLTVKVKSEILEEVLRAIQSSS